MHRFHITSFYHFATLTDEAVSRIAAELEKTATAHSLRGLCVLGAEGMNATVCGTAEACQEFETAVAGLLQSSEISFKNARSERQAFKRFKIDIRDEIVTIGKQLPAPDMQSDSYLSPEAWNEVLESGEEVLLLDTRNFYETQLGKFRDAVDPGLNTFAEFPDYLERAKIPKDKKVLMYCTGGIRCEKASIEMNRRGYQNVFQLEGGILKYLERYPEGSFDGECFVFDDRVAVNAELEPSARYRLCPHCGDPGDIAISCKHCEKRAIICTRCAKVDSYGTCSKNCRYHYCRTTADNAPQRGQPQ